VYRPRRHLDAGSPDAIAAYLAERAEAGLTYESIDMAWSAITYHHHRQGQQDPMADLTVHRMRRCRRCPPPC
jgi:sirohydrochlorin ferrochelatase